ANRSRWQAAGGCVARRGPTREPRARRHSMLTILLVLSLALSPVQAYNLGNKLYAQQNYSGAATAYEEALRAGPSAAVQYNLGNALFKSGKIGRAILNYRRARYLDPRDPDINANLTFARNYRVDKVPEAPSPLVRAVDESFHRLSRREAGLLAAMGFALAGLSLAGWIVRRWAVFVVLASVSLVLALFGIVTQLVWN